MNQRKYADYVWQLADALSTEEKMTDTLYELYVNWRKLKGYPSPAKAPIEAAIDKATGIDDNAIMAEFGDWLVNDCLQRLPESAVT